MKRLLMLAAAAVLSVSASACQDTTSPGAVLAGTYTLRSVNNVQPPVLIAGDPTGTTEWLGGEITINRDGSYTDVVHERVTPTGGVPQTFDDVINGTWSLSGNTLTFTDVLDPGNPYYATVSGNQLVFQNYASGSYYTVIYAK